MLKCVFCQHQKGKHNEVCFLQKFWNACALEMTESNTSVTKTKLLSPETKAPKSTKSQRSTEEFESPLLDPSSETGRFLAAP